MTAKEHFYLAQLLRQLPVSVFLESPNFAATRDIRHSKIQILLVLLTLVHLVSAVGFQPMPTVISEFTPSQLVAFTDSDYSNPFFHALYFDPDNSSIIYIGGLDFVYRLSTDNISLASLKSENLTAVRNFTTVFDLAVSDCRVRNPVNPDYQCQNHIRAISPTETELYVCATGSFSPQEFYLDYQSLRVVALSTTQDPLGARSKFTKCPIEPDSHYTFLYLPSGRGTPNNRSAIYSGISSSYDSDVFRSNLQLNRTSETEFYFLRSESIKNTAGLTFVASFEIDKYIFYFYREIADEVSTCGTVRYARVARVCKNDRGGSIKRTQFLTFVKAQLTCSVGTGDDVPFYYNELNDVYYDSVNSIFYGLFMASQTGSWGSAICSYSYDSINRKFDYGQFYAQEGPNQPWAITPNENVPSPRPSSCQLSDSYNQPLQTQSFALSHNLMAGAINQLTNLPLYFNQDRGYSQFAIDFVNGFLQNFTVFSLYTDNRPSEIVRLAQWTTNDKPSSRTFSVLKPFSGNDSRVWKMTMQKSSSGKSFLYIVKDTGVFQISMEICSQYKLCTECVVDPYCGWNATSHTCLPFRVGLLQNVASSSALTACNAVCKVSTSSPQFCIPGMALHMSCASFCAPEGDVTWRFPNGSDVQPLPLYSNPNYILTQDGGLVILNLTRNLNGTFQCLSNNVVLAEHEIKTSSCQFSEKIQDIVAEEYGKWCQEFEKYKTDYYNWVSVQNKCSCAGDKN